MDTSEPTPKWIENLAEQEFLLRAGDAVFGSDISEKDKLVLETSHFMRQLQDHFAYMVDTFNLRMNQPELRIKNAEKGAEGEILSLSRNGLRLPVQVPQPGRIQFLCDKLPGDFGGKPSVMFTGGVEAEFESEDLRWQFLGNTISAEQLARHYLAEFLQTSRPIPTS